MIFKQPCHGIRSQTGYIFIQNFIKATDKMLTQKGNVSGSFAQGRNFYGYDIQSIVEIFAKTALFDFFFELFGCCGNNANINL